MKVLILNTYYPEFLKWAYQNNPELHTYDYNRQLQALNELEFGTADFYSRNLRMLGQEAVDVHANNEALQRTWLREFSPAGSKSVRSHEQRMTLLSKMR